MARRLVEITLDNLDDLPERCRACVFWELDPVSAQAAADIVIEKEAWISDTLLEWGRCGQLAYVDGVAAGYVLYAPAAYVPRALAFPTAPVSPDAVLLMSARVMPDFAGRGLGRQLVQAVARDVAQRGIRAVEAFGHTSIAEASGCMLPAQFLRSVGFRTVRAHPQTPRLRLEAKVPTSWRAEVGQAVQRLISTAPARAI